MIEGIKAIGSPLGRNPVACVAPSTEGGGAGFSGKKRPEVVFVSRKGKPKGEAKEEFDPTKPPGSILDTHV